MKTTIAFAARLFIFALLTLSVYSCKKDDAPANNDKVTKSGIPLQASQEVGSVISTGSGTIDIDYTKSTKVLMYTVNWTGLTTNATLMHFHGPGLRGATAPPVIPVTGFTQTPSGSYHGTATLTSAQEADFLAGKYYFNIHTVTYGGGELRGQIEF